MSYCANCGTQHSPQDRFCCKCGACVAEAQPQPPPAPGQMVKLHFQREKQRFIVGVTGIEILIGNNVVANLPKEGRAVVEVPAGMHNVTIRNAGQIPLLLGPKYLNVPCMQDTMVLISIDRLTGCMFETKVWPLT